MPSINPASQTNIEKKHPTRLIEQIVDDPSPKIANLCSIQCLILLHPLLTLRKLVQKRVMSDTIFQQARNKQRPTNFELAASPLWHGLFPLIVELWKADSDLRFGPFMRNPLAQNSNLFATQTQ